MPAQRCILPTEITVIIPAWGQYKMWAEEAERSVRQALPGAIIRKVEPCFPGMTIGAVRNQALAAVTTTWVCFFDADDRMDCDGYLRLLAAGAPQEAVALVGRMEAWSPLTTKTISMSNPWSEHWCAARRFFATACLARNRYGIIGAIVRTDIIRDAGGFSPLNYCEDWALAAAIAWRGSIVIRPWTTVWVRIHRGSGIHQHGTPRMIVQMLKPLHIRWWHDDAIPLYAKCLLPLLATARLRQAWKRQRRRQRSHDDLLDALGIR